MWVCCRGAREFRRGELTCPGHVIKMEVCFDKDTLGHYFPTELVRLRLFKELSRKNDMSPKKTINDENAACKCGTRLDTRPDQMLALLGYKRLREVTKKSEMFAL